MKNSLSKRLLSLLLCLAMFLSLAPAAFAAPQEKRLVRDDESVVTVTLGDEPEEEPGEDPGEDPEEPPFWGDGDELNSNEPPSGRFNPYFKIADDMVGGTVTDARQAGHRRLDGHAVSPPGGGLRVPELERCLRTGRAILL